MLAEALTVNSAGVHGHEGGTGGRNANAQSVDHLGLREDLPRCCGEQRKAVHLVLPLPGEVVVEEGQIPGEEVEGAQRGKRGVLDTAETAVCARGAQGLRVRLTDGEGQTDLRTLWGERNVPHRGRSELDAAAEPPAAHDEERDPSGGATAS